MTKSTNSYLFPDLNVWLALSYQAHSHHPRASQWIDSVSDFSRICFCRLTQIGLLRLLTTEAVMNVVEALSQEKAWEVYDEWMDDARILFADEPAGLEEYFRTSTQSTLRAPKDWTNSYLSAFARAAGFKLITFDKALHEKTRNSILLGAQ